MKLFDKIRETNSIDELISAIKADKTTNDILSRRFPVRLIFLQRFQTLRKLIEELDILKIEICNIEDNLPKPDGWITKDSLIKILISLQKDTAVMPFSELIRFYSEPDFRNFFNQLLLIENTTDLTRRIYLPLIGIEERFEKEFFQAFTRKEESAPYWRIKNENPNSVKVYLSKDTNISKIGDLELIQNAEEWLKFWKRKSPCDVISCSKPLNLYFRNTLPDRIFTIEQFENIKFLIENVFNITIPILYRSQEFYCWSKLADRINADYKTFQLFIKQYFKISEIGLEIVLDLWLNTEEIFEKWLLKHYILSQKCYEESYLCKVFESLEDYSDHSLLKGLFKTIFIVEIKGDFIKDRFNYIKQFSVNKSIYLCDESIKELNDSYAKLKDINLLVSLITGFLSFEKELIFKLLSEEEEKLDIDLLEQRFPDLAMYVNEPNFNNIKEDQNWIFEYLQEYKRSKLTDRITKKLDEHISRFNKNEDSFYDWYHSFTSVHSLIHSIKNINKVIWIDALGIEWVSFIQNYCAKKKSDLQVVETFIGVSKLPSSTEFNRFEDSKYIQDFDQLIHAKYYSYPISIISEFDELKKILDSNLTLDTNQTVAIVSDHGLTALSRLVDSKKYGKDDRHEGRYIPVKDNEHKKDKDYISFKSDFDNKQYLIALRHNSLGDKPVREVHGGCTPEEIFVPVIVISNRQVTTITKYVISIGNSNISKKNPIVSIDIKPKPSSAIAKIAGKDVKLSYNSKTKKWETTLDKKLSGEIQIKVKVDKIEQMLTINIISGLIEEDLF